MCEKCMLISATIPVRPDVGLLEAHDLARLPLVTAKSLALAETEYSALDLHELHLALELLEEFFILRCGGIEIVCVVRPSQDLFVGRHGDDLLSGSEL